MRSMGINCYHFLPIPPDYNPIEKTGAHIKKHLKKVLPSCNTFFEALFVVLVSINYIWTLYSMKIKEQTRKLAAGCSKHCFEVVDRTDEVSNHIYGKATLTWFEEIFEEY